MIKSQKEIPLAPEESKHKKKSQSKGQPRAKHKHEYETVLLNRFYNDTDYETGKEHTRVNQMPFKVCMICGRVGDFDCDESYYVKKPIKLPWLAYNKELSDKALSLPQWCCYGWRDKFAKRMECKANEQM